MIVVGAAQVLVNHKHSVYYLYKVTFFYLDEHGVKISFCKLPCSIPISCAIV